MLGVWVGFIKIMDQNAILLLVPLVSPKCATSSSAAWVICSGSRPIRIWLRLIWGLGVGGRVVVGRRMVVMVITKMIQVVQLVGKIPKVVKLMVKMTDPMILVAGMNIHTR